MYIYYIHIIYMIFLVSVGKIKTYGANYAMVA